jgi:hypothetical protein
MGRTRPCFHSAADVRVAHCSRSLRWSEDVVVVVGRRGLSQMRSAGWTRAARDPEHGLRVRTVVVDPPACAPSIGLVLPPC